MASDIARAKADTVRQLLGTWRMLSWTRTLAGSGEVGDAFGPDPVGYIHYGDDGRVMVFVLKRDRPRPAGALPTDAEKIALFDSMFAYCGRYVVEADCVVHTLDASWNELWTGTRQTRMLGFEGKRLIYRTPETVDPLDGARCTYEVVFEKA